FTGGGTVVARCDYDPYGRSTTVLGTTPTDFNFTGLYRHSKSNLDLAVYRAYDPDLGRWLSRDPLRNAERTQGPNLYAYVSNNPAVKTDPSGLYIVAPPISPFILPVVGVAVGLEIGNIPAIRDLVDRVSYNLFFRPPEVPLPTKSRPGCEPKKCIYDCEWSGRTELPAFLGICPPYREVFHPGLGYERCTLLRE